MEMLAAYAAVAISNARFYQQITERDQVLTRRNENLALVNELASVLASSENIDQVLEKVLTQVMDYLRLDVGEVFLRQEDGKVLQLALHHGEGPSPYVVRRPVPVWRRAGRKDCSNRPAHSD